MTEHQPNLFLFNRIVSFIITVSILYSIYQEDESGEGLFKGIFVYFGILSLIWFGDFIGEHTVGIVVKGSTINVASPGIIVKFFGWSLLIGPYILTV